MKWHVKSETDTAADVLHHTQAHFVKLEIILHYCSFIATRKSKNKSRISPILIHYFWFGSN